MSFAILGLGTAVPSTAVDQTTAAGVARSLCCRTPEHETWLPVIYSQTERRIGLVDSSKELDNSWRRLH